MSIKDFPVAYYDESGVWNLFSNYVIERLPILGVKLNTVEGEILLPPLSIKFIPHANAFWHSTPEDRYLKPYLWIFVLKYSNHEIFKRDIKLKLKELIHTMQENNVEWLVLFVPTLSRLVKSDHKALSSNYEKVQNDLNSMFNKKNTSRFYCSSNKTYLDLAQPSAIRDEFLQSIGNGISIGIQTAINSHVQASALNSLIDPYKYCLHQEALALIYSLSGLKLQASLFYDSIICKDLDLDLFKNISKNDLNIDYITEIDYFRANLPNKEISSIIFYRYIHERQKELLEASKNYTRISDLAIHFIQTVSRIFINLDDEDIKKHRDVYIYQIGEMISEYIVSKIVGNA